MRSLLSIFIIAFLLLTSCQEKNGDNDNLSPQDTTLYISFNINGKDIKYFQHISNSTGTYLGSSMQIDGKNVTNYGFNFFFLNPDDKQYPQAQLCFWDTIWVKHNEEKIIKFSSRIRDKYKFTSPKLNRIDFVPADTIFMVGAAFFLSYKSLSTKALFDNFKYDYDIFSNPILKDSYLIINRIKPLSDQLFLVEGIFNTALMSSTPGGNPPEVVPVSGNFKFAIR